MIDMEKQQEWNKVLVEKDEFGSQLLENQLVRASLKNKLITTNFFVG